MWKMRILERIKNESEIDLLRMWSGFTSVIGAKILNLAEIAIILLSPLVGGDVTAAIFAEEVCPRGAHRFHSIEFW